jgi:hypothetical protein
VGKLQRDCEGLTGLLERVTFQSEDSGFCDDAPFALEKCRHGGRREADADRVGTDVIWRLPLSKSTEAKLGRNSKARASRGAAIAVQRSEDVSRSDAESGCQTET